MKTERNDCLMVRGVDYVQVYIDDETYIILERDKLEDSEVTVELHEYDD